MFPGPTELRLIGCSIESIWTQKSKSSTSTPKKHLAAKSRPMMSLIARAPSTLSSSTSESPGKKSYESQSPWSAKQPVVDRDVYSARYSRWDDDKAWSSQEWKADESIDDRTVQPVVTSWRKSHESQSSFFHEDPACYCGRGRTS